MAKARGSQNGDTPFTFKAKNGVITIPASEVYDPDADSVVAFDEARNRDDVAAAAAMMRMIKGGFSPEVAEKINLKASEVEAFMVAYMRHTGVDVPKS